MDNPTILIFIFQSWSNRELACVFRAGPDFSRRSPIHFCQQRHVAAPTPDAAFRGNTGQISVGRLRIQNAVPSHVLLCLGRVPTGSSVWTAKNKTGQILVSGRLKFTVILAQAFARGIEFIFLKWCILWSGSADRKGFQSRKTWPGLLQILFFHVRQDCGFFRSHVAGQPDAVFTGGHPIDRFKNSGEIELILIAQGSCHLFHTQARLLEQLAGTVHPQMNKKVNRCVTGRVFKQGEKVGRRNPDERGERGHLQRLVQMLLHVSDALPDFFRANGSIAAFRCRAAILLPFTMLRRNAGPSSSGRGRRFKSVFFHRILSYDLMSLNPIGEKAGGQSRWGPFLLIGCSHCGALAKGFMRGSWVLRCFHLFTSRVKMV
jgi:hypothetical protein